MLTHNSIYHNILGANDLVMEVGDINHTYLSLVLYHMLMNIWQFFYKYLGAQIYFAEGPDKFAALLEVTYSIDSCSKII